MRAPAFHTSASLPLRPPASLATGYDPPHPPTTCSATTSLSRRTAVSLLALLAATPLLYPPRTQARGKPKVPLAVSLVPLVRVRDSVSQLSEDVSTGTNGDVRRIVRVVLKGNDIMKAARDSGLWLTKEEAEGGERHAREALEYLTQVTEYYEATGNRERMGGAQLKFCLMAIEAAGKELDLVLALFEDADVRRAREVVQGGVA